MQWKPILSPSNEAFTTVSSLAGEESPPPDDHLPAAVVGLWLGFIIGTVQEFYFTLES